MVILKSNNTLISINNPKRIFAEGDKVVVRTTDGKEYKGTFVDYYE